MGYIRTFERTYDGVTFTGTYHYTKSEKATLTHPGADAEVYIIDIMVEGSDVNLIDIIKPTIIEQMEEELRDELMADE